MGEDLDIEIFSFPPPRALPSLGIGIPLQLCQVSRAAHVSRPQEDGGTMLDNRSIINSKASSDIPAPSDGGSEVDSGSTSVDSPTSGGSEKSPSNRAGETSSIF